MKDGKTKTTSRKAVTIAWALTTAVSTTCAISWILRDRDAMAIACIVWAVCCGIMLGMNLTALAMKR
jgi:hypothetical protein